MADRFIGAVRKLSLAAGIVAAGLIAVSVFVVCEMVFVRYVLGRTTIWQTDFVIYSLVAATFVGSSYAEFAKEVPDGKKLIDDALSVK